MIEMESGTTPKTQRQILTLHGPGAKPILSLGRECRTRACASLAKQAAPDAALLVFQLLGRQHYTVGNQTLCLSGGEMLHIPPSCSFGTEGAMERGKVAWLRLNIRAAEAEDLPGISREGLSRILDLLSGNPPGLARSADEVPALIDAAFAHWSPRNDALAREIIVNRMAALVIGAAARFTMPSEVEEHENDHRIRKVLTWMERHQDSSASGSQLARLAGLSRSRFHLHFRRLTGSSPNDYWARLRVERAARRLLEAPTLTVTEIAQEFGFSSSQYFATVFRKYCGLSPAQHRSAGKY